MTKIRRSTIPPLWRVLAAILVAGALACHGHPHDDHGAHDGDEELPGGGAVTLWTEKSELFMEHPALLVGEPAKLLVHLTALSDFAPLLSGKLTLQFMPEGGGPAVEFVQEEPRAPGIYGPVVTLPTAGAWNLRLVIDSPQVSDVIDVPPLPVYADRDALPAAEPETGADGISFLKEQQWKTPGFRTAFAATASVAATIEVPGELVAAADRTAEVSAPVPGVVDPESARRAPVVGQSVERGQVLTALVPALGESGSALAGARAELREAEDEFARARRLLAVEAVPERRLHEARIRLDAARETLAGLAGEGTLAADGRVVLRAPLDGVAARRDLVPGSRVDAGALLFTIVDPSVLWLRAHVPVAEAARLREGAGASFTIEGGGVTGEAARTLSVGSLVDPGTRTIALLFEVPNPDGALKIGAHARVAVRAGAEEEGVVIPDAALLDEDGRPIAYVQAEGERFERRELVLGPRAGGDVLVRSGIAAGERVVTGAAYQVRLASLSTSVPAHGHAH
jgi:RND family efflux transporter MFP subunit